MKRSPRCMQIDLLPLMASNITVARNARSPSHGRDGPNARILPAVWDEKLRVWTRNGTQPSMLRSGIDHCLQGQKQPAVHAKDQPSLLGHSTVDDEDSMNEMQSLTTSTPDDKECSSHVDIPNAAERAWLSSLLDIPKSHRAKDMIVQELTQSEANRPEEAPAPELPLKGVESLCSHLDTWDVIKLQGHELSNGRSRSLNDDGLPCPAQVMADDAHQPFVDVRTNQPLKLCPPFTSPWLNSKAHLLTAEFEEGLNNALERGLDWTDSGKATDGDDMDEHGFDGIGLRPESESNRVRSRQYWNGDHSNGPNVGQRIQELPHQNIIANEFVDDYDGFGPGENLPKWFPQPGDIMITKRSRHGSHVTLYKDPAFFLYTGEARQLRATTHDFGDGDVAIRLGKFTRDWKWHPSPCIEAFLCDLRQVRPWWLVARTYNKELQPPEYEFDDQLHAPVNAVDRNFRPRDGDLVVRAVPGEYNWGLYWWTHYFNFSPCDMVLRAGYEVRANGTCMVVELYYRELDDRDWSFRGRDVWTYLSEEPLYPAVFCDSPGMP